jgi:hypothetical protein
VDDAPDAADVPLDCALGDCELPPADPAGLSARAIREALGEDEPTAAA